MLSVLAAQCIPGATGDFRRSGLRPNQLGKNSGHQLGSQTSSALQCREQAEGAGKFIRGTLDHPRIIPHQARGDHQGIMKVIVVISNLCTGAY